MAEDTFEFTGKTVDEAVAQGLTDLKVARSDIAVEVLSKGSRGIFGIGSEPARVRITLEPSKSAAPAVEAEEEPMETAKDVDPAPTETSPAESEAVVEEAEASETAEAEAPVAADAPAQEREGAASVSDEELASMASEMLGEIVRLMGFEATVVSAWQEPDEHDGAPYLLLDIEGEGLSALIGRRGETLASLQYLVRLMVNQRIKQWRNIIVDVEKYKERREEQLNQLALRMADQIAESGRATALEPMPLSRAESLVSSAPPMDCATRSSCPMWLVTTGNTRINTRMWSGFWVLTTWRSFSLS